MWLVEEIICAYTFRRRGKKRREALVRWIGYADPTWTELRFLEHTDAL